MAIPFDITAILPALFAGLLAFAAAVLALAVTLSFSIAWYERSNADPGLMDRRRPAQAVRLMLTEFACLLLTLLLRPFGWLPARLPRGPSRRPPVILLHGLFQNRSCLFLLQWRLRAAGFERIVSINTPPWHDLETLTDRLRHAVAEVLTTTGAKQVCLVGHSMGGMIARNFIQLCGGASQVSHCLTLGAPHTGSKLAPFAVSALGRGLLPGSAFLTRLNAESLPDGISFTSIYSRHDNIVVPTGNARLDGAENIELTGLGHTSMLFSPRVAREVVKALGEAVTSDQ